MTLHPAHLSLDHLRRAAVSDDGRFWKWHLVRWFFLQPTNTVLNEMHTVIMEPSGLSFRECLWLFHMFVKRNRIRPPRQCRFWFSFRNIILIDSRTIRKTWILFFNNHTTPTPKAIPQSTHGRSAHCTRACRCPRCSPSRTSSGRGRPARYWRSEECADLWSFIPSPASWSPFVIDISHLYVSPSLYGAVDSTKSNVFDKLESKSVWSLCILWDTRFEIHMRSHHLHNTKPNRKQQWGACSSFKNNQFFVFWSLISDLSYLNELALRSQSDRSSGHGDGQRIVDEPAI